MKDHYDFSKGVKNPFAGKFKNGYTVTVHYPPPSENNWNETKEKIVALLEIMSEQEAEYLLSYIVNNNDFLCLLKNTPIDKKARI